MKFLTLTNRAVLSSLLIIGIYAANATAETENKPAESTAKKIEATATIESDHPAVEEGISCNDCHEITLDANTAATQAWLTGDYLKFKAGEGIMPRDQLWNRIVDIFKQKDNKRTMVLATAVNNNPLTTTAEYAIDPENGILYGLHEKSTEKLFHIRNNPSVCLNWHREFDDNFLNTLCIQVVGKAEIISGTDKRFLQGLDIYPYQYGAAPRKMTVEQWKNIIIKEMEMTKIVIEQITLVDGQLAKSDFRTSQRWIRK